MWTKDAVKVTRGEDQLKGFNKTGFSDRQHCVRIAAGGADPAPDAGHGRRASGTLRGFEFQPDAPR